MTNFFPDSVKEAASKIGGDWIKAEEFDGEGLILQSAKPLETVKSFNPKYGAEEKDWLFKQDLLEVGETYRYTFNTPDGMERKIDSKSAPLFIALKSVEELAVGDWLKITRTGKTDSTRYSVERVKAPAAVSPAKPLEKVDYPQDDLGGSTPF